VSRFVPLGATAAAITAGLALALAFPPGALAQAARPRLDFRVFARVPNPGQPEAIGVAADGTVYVGTHQQGRGPGAALPSRVFAYSRSGALRRSYELRGQKLDEDHGIQGLAIDGDGLLYLLDRSSTPRVVVLDPRTGAQRDYARFRDVPGCMSAGRMTDCSATVGNAEAVPNTAAFGPDGSLYVTDIEQALIWRIPRGGGRMEVFFTHPRLENLFGPNGIQVLGDGRTLMFALTAQSPGFGNPSEGGLFTLPIRSDGRPGELRELWHSRPLDGPDGFAVARSGNVYLALAGASQFVQISPAGQEVARLPDPVANRGMSPRWDGPASVAFLGQSVLVTNQTFPVADPASWVVWDVHTGESGLPLFRPRIGTGSAGRRPRLSLLLSFRTVRDRGGDRCAVGNIRAAVRGADRAAVVRADFYRGVLRIVRDSRPPFSAMVFRPHRAPTRNRLIRVRVRLNDGRQRTLKMRVRTCAFRAP
jgi:sugar lactone lactonase YvrE